MDERIHCGSVRDTAQQVERRAVIDVGTNSVKLLVADVGSALRPVLKSSLQTGLGQGAFSSRRLRPEAIAFTADAVAEFAAEAVALGSAYIRVVATSATREAANGHELAQAIRRAAGLSVEVISGEQEADYVFEGVTSDPLIGPRPVLIVDVGGGSTEWVVGESGLICFRKSTRLGTARLLELHPLGDPPGRAALARLRAIVSEFIRAEVSPSVQPVLWAFCGRPVRLVGLGGALEALARLSSTLASRESGKCGFLRREQLVEQVEQLWGLSLQGRRHLPGLDPEKAEVILPEAVIHEVVLNHFGMDGMLISSRGLREGALLARSTRADTVAASASQGPAQVPPANHWSWELNRPPRQAC
jgi:exopolyphosphatase/guanosine-5'-triphosphate,3'-diphosphate pyrophosphatase